MQTHQHWFLAGRAKLKWCPGRAVNREFKHDVYGRQQTPKIHSKFVFFSSNPELNHSKREKCLLLFTANANISTLLYRQLNIDVKSFIFAVCRLA